MWWVNNINVIKGCGIGHGAWSIGLEIRGEVKTTGLIIR
jgi:hypothetical protein